MKLFAKIAVLSLFAGTFAACGSADEEYDAVKQQDEFKEFLETNDIFYDEALARKFIFKVELPDSLDYFYQTSGSTPGDVVRAGDRIWISYAGYLFNKSAAKDGAWGRGSMFTTNIEDYSDVAGWGENPNVSELEITVGDGNLLKGLKEGIAGSRVGTGFLLYLSADYAYGEDNPVGVVDPKLPVVYEVYIRRKSS